MTLTYFRGAVVRRLLAGCSGLLLAANSVFAAIPYTPVPIGGPYPLGPQIISPRLVLGKEYSHSEDHEITAAGVSPDPEQIVAWDGIGGTANGLDFTGTRPNFTPDLEIDAIANHRDLYYSTTRDDKSHIIYSVSRDATTKLPAPASIGVPSGGPIPLVGGNVIGGAGEISHELSGVHAGPNVHGLWASQGQINGMPLPEDIDGLEVWGPEPGFTSDTDKYSLVSDSLSGTSVWNGTGTSYISHAAIFGAVITNLGPLPTNIPQIQQLIDLDALMVHDLVGSGDLFESDPTGNGGIDEILFSIRQVVNAGYPSGFYATGSEIMWLNGAGATGFLDHGGHVWDKGYALAEMVALLPSHLGGSIPVQLDLDALEAVTAPEPTTAVLVAIGLAGFASIRRRSGLKSC
ncbi:MAG: PEP-CTERM sorting domain-containing protein [Pirellulales bacterium]|nr:PEP-CTERM sorting domain-containing protein [Pirellulales bacterium]